MHESLAFTVLNGRQNLIYFNNFFICIIWQININFNPLMAIVQAVCYCLVGYLVIMFAGFYQIKEGYVGLIKEFGVLKKDLKEPGFHFLIPGYQQVLHLNIMLQTDIIQKVPCGTANGLLISFDKIEVVNRLDRKHAFKTVLNYTENYEKFWITDKIHHQINQFCSKHTLQQIYIDLFDKLDEELIKALNKDLSIWSPGIQILSVRVTKPTIPKKILQNVQFMQKVKIQYLIAIQRQKISIEERKTNQTQRRIKAESNLQVKKIEMQKFIQTKKNDLKMAKIESQIIFNKQKTLIQTQFLASFQQANLYPQLFTKEYLKYLANEALTTNLTITLGDSVPNIITGGQNFKKRKPK